MDLHVSLSGKGQLTADLYRQLKEAILDGRLRPGDSVPATRELARRLDVSRNTVMNAYQQLIAEGFLLGRVGAGSFVAAPPEVQPRRTPTGTALSPRPIWRTLVPEPRRRGEPAFNFQLGAPDPALFPWQEWRRLVARQLRGRRPFAGYPDPEGPVRLRAAIARHVGLSRSVRAGADDVIVTSGAQQAFDLIARVLVEPGEIVAVEDPGYSPARRAFEAAGARIVPVRVDGEGMDVAALPDRARLVYVTPSHQFPLGVPMSLARRMALLAWAERRGAALVEDDYDSEFRFDGRPLEPLQSLDRSGRVIYIGTFSKVLLPTLRIGFAVAPRSVMAALHAAKSLADSHGQLHDQLALAELIDDGGFARHVRRLVRTYRERRDVLHAAIARELGPSVTVMPSSAGLHTTLLFRDRTIDSETLVERALAAGVRIESLHRHFYGRPRPGLAFGYGLIAATKIAEGVRRLVRCLP